jgi:hypothetical protein
MNPKKIHKLLQFSFFVMSCFILRKLLRAEARVLLCGIVSEEQEGRTLHTDVAEMLRKEHSVSELYQNNVWLCRMSAKTTV